LQSVAATVPPPTETIVVADGDTDGSWRLAEDFGLQVVRIPTPGGPAKARNLGARKAQGDILFFLDADVTVPRDALDRMVTVFQKDPDLAAAFGSYDDTPFESNFLSQYKNLFHHYIHQNSSADASTFWTGCGAIRRDIFLAMGGFDENYGRPSIEDIDLGYRLKRAGYNINLVKELEVKHLKRWEARSLLKADIFDRALPWTKLILEEGRFIHDLNLKTSSRISVMLVFLLLMALVGMVWIPQLFLLAICSVVLLLALNWRLYLFFSRKKGMKFTARAIPMHWLYYLYSGIAFGVGYIGHKLKRSSRASPTL
jgi:GT2 family glycosyltransferase